MNTGSLILILRSGKQKPRRSVVRLSSLVVQSVRFVIVSGVLLLLIGSLRSFVFIIEVSGFERGSITVRAKGAIVWMDLSGERPTTGDTRMFFVWH